MPAWMGRELADFKKLWEAEQKLIDKMGDGTTVAISDGLPPENAPQEHRLRASFVRYLALGGCDACRPPEKGVQFSGAYIEGDGPKGAETKGLDLTGCEVQRPLTFTGSYFPEPVLLSEAKTGSLRFNGSTFLGGIFGSSLQVAGILTLNEVKLDGQIYFYGARVSGNFECSNSNISAGIQEDGRLSNCLNLEGVEISGHVLLKTSACIGGIRLYSAKVIGNVEITDCTILAPDNAIRCSLIAVDAESLNTSGHVFLKDTKVFGSIRLYGSEIGQNLECQGLTFGLETMQKTSTSFSLSPPGTGGRRFIDFDSQSKVVPKLKQEMNLTSASVTAKCIIRGVSWNNTTLDVEQSKLGQITDSIDSWPATGDLKLTGALYSGFSDNAALSVEERLEWLGRAKRFSPQPYEQLAKVLRETGHGSDARKVMIEKEKLQRRARRAAWSLLGKLWFGFWDGLLGITVRYGRQPLLAFVWLFGFWIAGLGIFGGAQYVDAIKPNTAFTLRAPEWVLCASGAGERKFYASLNRITSGRAQPEEGQVSCYLRQPEAANYPRFNAATYALDTLLPIVDLEMQGYWLPDETKPFGKWARWYLWAQIFVGWALSLLAVAGFSGLVKSD